MGGLNSLDRVLAILDVFTEARPEWTPEALMAELGYARPTLYRYVKTLREAGLLTALPGGALMLGPRVVEMDYLMRTADPLVRAGRPHLAALTAEWPCTALLVRWYGQRLLCVASEVSAPDPVSSYPRGRPMPLVRGAISRSIMAFVPRAQMTAWIEANLPDLQAVGLGASPAEVAARLRTIRRTGYAVAYGEVTPGVVGIAAPVFDAARAPVASLCVTLAGTLMTPERIAAIGTRLREAARALATDMDRVRGAAAAPADSAPADPPRLRA